MRVTLERFGLYAHDVTAVFLSNESRLQCRNVGPLHECFAFGFKYCASQCHKHKCELHDHCDLRVGDLLGIVARYVYTILTMVNMIY